jgi:hypothetical protein
VENVVDFVEEAKERGCHFGPVHRGDGYKFANCKDPSGNSVSVSSRGFLAKAVAMKKRIALRLSFLKFYIGCKMLPD